MESAYENTNILEKHIQKNGTVEIYTIFRNRNPN